MEEELLSINNKIYTICNTYKKYSKKNICTTHSNNYFEVEENYSRETREAIIIQAFTRLKEALNAESNSKIQIININTR